MTLDQARGFGGFKRRDDLVCAVCNFLLRHVASRSYRRAIEGSVWYGLHAAARDVPPPANLGVPESRTTNPWPRDPSKPEKRG